MTYPIHGICHIIALGLISRTALVAANPVGVMSSDEVPFVVARAARPSKLPGLGDLLLIMVRVGLLCSAVFTPTLAPSVSTPMLSQHECARPIMDFSL